MPWSRLLGLLLLGSLLAGCAYYNTLYNARNQYETAVESSETRKEKREQDELDYWNALQEWIAAGGSGEEMLAELEAAAVDSTTRADSLKATLIDSLALLIPLSEVDSTALEQAYGQLDSTLRAAERDEEEETKSRLIPRPKRPRWTEFAELVPAEERMLDACITKCAKVIALYPDSKWRDDAVFLMGKALFEKRYFADARTKFVEIRTYYPGSPFVQEARLREGHCLHEAGAGAEGRTIWQELLASEASSELRRAAGLALAGSLLDEGDERAAARIYAQLSEELPGSDRAGLELRRGECLRLAGAPDEAFAAFEAALAGGPSSAQRFEATLASALALEEAGNTEEAIARLKALAGEQRYFREASQAWMEIARIQREGGEAEAALSTYRVVVQSYPGTNDSAAALLELSRLHRDENSDLEKARRTLKLLIRESPESDAAAAAKAELADLRRFLTLQRDAAQASGAQAERAQFLLAEHLLIEEKREAEALAGYRALVASAPASSWRPKADLAIAWILAESSGGQGQADSVYQAILEGFPGTRAAAISAAALDLPVPEITIADVEPGAIKPPPEPPAVDRPAARTSPLGDDEDKALRGGSRRQEPRPASERPDAAEEPRGPRQEEPGPDLP